MASLLRIDASPRGNASISRQVGDAFTEAWKSAHPGATVVTRDLAFNQPTYVDVQWIQGAYSAPDQHTEAHKAALKLSNEIIGEVEAADEILITLPMYNLSIPAVLKAWVDHLVRAGKTFAIESTGYKGLLRDRKVTVVLAAGGKYAGTPVAGYDQATPYLKLILGFIGLQNVRFIDAAGSNLLSQQNLTEEQFLQPIREQAAHLATA